MIISRTPLRLTLGGGGTDLPCYYSKFGGFVVSASLDKYVYVIVKRRFEQEIRVSYSVTEIVDCAEKVEHPVVREALKLLGLNSHLEVISIGDVPARSGLGSSGSFSVGLLHALHAYKGENPDRFRLAEEGCHLNMELLREPSGKQDEYVASFGGFLCLEIDRSGRVDVNPLELSPDVVSELGRSLLFFYTGIRRDASEVLSSQAAALRGNDGACEAFHRIKEIGRKVKGALEAGDVEEFGRLQHEHWLAKRATSPSISTDAIDRWYQIGMENGALGGKIMGAGGGGFLMFCCSDGRDAVRKAMARERLREVQFGFGGEGSKIIINL